MCPNDEDVRFRYCNVFGNVMVNLCMLGWRCDPCPRTVPSDSEDHHGRTCCGQKLPCRRGGALLVLSLGVDLPSYE